MSDGAQFRNIEDIQAYLAMCERNRVAVALGYDLRNMLMRMADEIQALQNNAASTRTNAR